ncbi:nucleotidyltransferase domain-containing protein [Candidatus Woesearchaeota archaeon]|nr:nucleotidyltransferase domain-containing protein [Candidatus Woesearchaeota archaeon]
MIIGYNNPRPVERNYRDFEQKLVEGLKKLQIRDLALMFYGSYVRGDHIPGRSDIDAVLVFPGGVVIDKEHLDLCSRVLSEAQRNNNIPFQVGVCDKKTLEDGRFNSYMNDFEDYFVEEARLLIGPDPREYMFGESEKTGDLHSLSFNLRKARMGLLFSHYHREVDYESFIRNFNKSLDAASRGSKQILHLVDGKIRKNRFSGIEGIEEEFPEVDTTTLKRIKGYYTNPKDLDEIYKDPDKVLELWVVALTTFEQIIDAYIRKYPKV